LTAAKVAIVTGAGRGIGAGIARAMAQAGYAVIVHYRNTDPQPLIETIRGAGGCVAAFQANLANEQEAAALVAFAIETFGRLDVLVNNAGVAKGGALADMDSANINEMVAINVTGLLLTSKHAAAAFGDAGGCIINIGSINGLNPVAGGAVYSATKAAVHAITVALARELGRRNIRVNAVAPGLTDVGKFDAETLEKIMDHLASTAPSVRLGLPKDIASVVVFLASEAALWVNGQVIAVSGGAT
jgi:3-oxoacyl-[acyl-carrier protein] reductase